MKHFPLTVVIPCEYDPRLGLCLASINADVEVLVAMSGACQRTVEFLRQYPAVRSVQVPERGLAGAYNRGIVTATNDWILLMDSDCVFSPATIDRMWRLTKNFILVKGRVEFQCINWTSQFIARVREFTTSDTVSAYSPPLLFHRSIRKQIGYYFDPRLVWAEDADFNNRVQRQKIPIGYDPQAIIQHKPLTIRDDLRSAYRYGVGRQIGKTIGVYEPHTWRSFWKNVRKVGYDTWHIWRRKGTVPALYYLLLWNTVFRWGTFAQHYFRMYSRRLI